MGAWPLCAIAAIFGLRHSAACANLPLTQTTEVPMASTPFPLGSVSSGTLKQPDLVAAFAATLDDLEPRSALAAEAQEYDPEIAEPDVGNWLLEELFEALDDLAPPYCYFGAVEGNGSDFGFWPHIDAINEAIASGELLEISDLSKLPATYNGEALLVNDHGNMTLYSVKGGVATEVWSTV